MSQVPHHFLWKLIFVSLNVTVFAEKTFYKIHHVLTLEFRRVRSGLDSDVTTGATGSTAVAPNFSDTLTLSQQRGADPSRGFAPLPIAL